MNIKSCTKCDLCISNNFVPVSGRGSHNADIFIIGEAPGYYEMKKREPFVGKSGTLLQTFINRYNFKDKVYITNIVKCRPPGNRNPTNIEIETCIKYLILELYIIKPKIIILLGNIAIQGYLGKTIPISKVSGKVLKLKPIVAFLYHPAYVLRNNESIKDYIKVFDEILEYYVMNINASHKVMM